MYNEQSHVRCIQPGGRIHSYTMGRPLVKNEYQITLFSYFSTKTYVMGTQKNRLNETVLLSTQNICSSWWIRKYLNFYAQKFCLSKPTKGLSSLLQIIFVHLDSSIKLVNRDSSVIIVS